MRRLAVVIVGVGLVLASAVSVSAQSLLERLEKQLKSIGQERVTPPAEAVPPEPVPPGTTTGKPQAAGYAGITADNKNGAVEVISVRAGGPADRAGIKPGDRIVSAGGAPVKVLDEFAAVLEKLPAGARIELTVSRSGREQKIPLVLTERDPPAGTVPEELPPDEPQPPAPVGAVLGVRASPIDGAVQRRYGLTVRSGAVIESIERGSPADRFGLPLGAAIVAIDGERVDSPEDLAAIMAGSRAGDNVEITYYQRATVLRKRVRLAPAVAVAPPGVPDRPFLRKLEQALDGAIITAPAPRDPRSLEEEVVQLRARVESLEQKLAELSARLEAPAAVKPGVLNPPAVPKPPVPLEGTLQPLEP